MEGVVVWFRKGSSEGRRRKKERVAVTRKKLTLILSSIKGREVLSKKLRNKIKKKIK
jgi:hypothetical protein